MQPWWKIVQLFHRAVIIKVLAQPDVGVSKQRMPAQASVFAMATVQPHIINIISVSVTQPHLGNAFEVIEMLANSYTALQPLSNT